MTPSEHQAFTEAVRARLAGDPEVLGLVGLGSTSGLPPAPDRFSDHDFFLVTRPGAQERFRHDLGWLPSTAGPVVLAFRETVHGVKALLESGHLIEFAAFDPEELALARINRYAVLLDRSDLAARLARVREATLAGLATPAADLAWHAGQFLTTLVIGASRAARGEALSGHQLVRVAALGHLLVLLRAGRPPEAEALLDDLDPNRRLERAFPGTAAEIDEALRLPVVASARALLSVLRRARPGLLPEPGCAAVERSLDRAGAPAP
jgi:lincosamide nucleotidyltransferase